MGYGIISGRFVNDKSHLYFDLQEQKTVSAHDRNGFDIRQVHPSTLTWKDFVDNIIPVTRRSSLMLIQIWFTGSSTSCYGDGIATDLHRFSEPV